MDGVVNIHSGIGLVEKIGLKLITITICHIVDK